MKFEPVNPALRVLPPRRQFFEKFMARSSDRIANTKQRRVDEALTRARAFEGVAEQENVRRNFRDEFNKSRVRRQLWKVFAEVNESVLGVKRFESPVLLVLVKKQKGNYFRWIERFRSARRGVRSGEVMVVEGTKRIDKTEKVN